MKPILPVLTVLASVAAGPTACGAPSTAPQSTDRVFIMTADIIGPDRKSALGLKVPDGDHRNFPNGRTLLLQVDADVCAGFSDDNDDPCPVNAKRPPGATLPVDEVVHTSWKRTIAVAQDFHDVIHFQLGVHRATTMQPGSIDVVPYGYTIRCEIVEQGKPGTVAANAARVDSKSGARVEAVCDRNIRV